MLLRRSAVEGPRGRCAGLALVFAIGCSWSDPRPNLVLITIDTLRADALACYGGDATTGLALCSLADHGVRFEWALSAAPSTAPSVASILTSRYPSQHGVSQYASTILADEQRSVAEELAAAGYDTGAFVSNPVIRRSRNLHQGFAHYDDQRTRSEGSRSGMVERAARETTDAALAWLADAREPWFVWLHYQDPHGPYAPPGGGPLPRDAGKRLPLLEDQSGLGGIPAYQALPGLYGVDAYREAYRREIRYLDEHIARLIVGVDARGRAPLIVATSDHGEAFGEDGYFFAHGHSLGLDQLRVPLLVRRAGARGGADVVSHAVAGVDVAPTLLRAAGLELPATFAGESLPIEEAAGAPEAARVLFAEHRVRVAMVSDGLYYARDREELAGAPLLDRITGGVLLPLPIRSARLTRDGSLPDYGLGPVGEAALEMPSAAALEELEAFESERRAPDAILQAPLSQDRREELEALGYLE